MNCLYKNPSFRFVLLMLISFLLLSNGLSQIKPTLTFDNANVPRTVITKFDDTLFNEVTTPIINLGHGTVAWGDYDNDDDLDLLVNGIGEYDSIRQTRIYRNDSATFVDSNDSLVGVNNNNGAAWCDYDNDGDLDMFVLGAQGPGATNCVSKLYRNDGGTFVDAQASITGLLGTMAWGDYNNDGNVDLIITGTANGGIPFTTKLYENYNGTFVEKSTNIPGVWGAQLSWADYDGDGDLDFLISGHGSVGTITRIYRNNGGDIFEDIYADLPQCASSGISWGDYDNDADLDLLIVSANASDIYRNDNGTFVSTNMNFPRLFQPAVAFGDYDNDGDLDIIMTGFNQITNTNQTYLFRNDGASYTDLGINIGGGSYSSVAWGDFNNDGYLDLAISGFTSSVQPHGTFTKIYQSNQGSNIFSQNTAPSSPTNLAATVTNHSVQLSWNSSSDTQTPSQSLTYNIRIGTTPGGVQVISPMSDISTGQEKVVHLGNVNFDTTKMFNDFPTGTYYWSVQAIDGAFAGSAFAQEDSFVIVPMFTEVDDSLIQVGHGTTAFGDYDNDGDLDILITGIGGRDSLGDTNSPHYSKVYRNDNGRFVDIDAGLIGVHNNDGTIWNDYNNDGNLDLFIGGGVDGNGDPISKIYRNDNGIFTEIEDSLTGLIGTASWGDYDADGDLDLIITGSSDYGNTFLTKLYRNENGSFTEVPTNLPGVWGASIAWGDYDNDGDLDLLMSGYGTNHTMTKLYRNEGGNDSCRFVDTYTSLANVDAGTVSWGDYNNDGNLDILLCGYKPGGVPFSSIYRNNGTGGFVDISPGIIGITYGTAMWGDFDNDGDLDILLSGKVADGNLITKIFRNDNGSFTDIGEKLQGLYYTGAAYGDFDNDGDLDLLFTGFSKQGNGDMDPWKPVTKLYKSSLQTPNQIPSTPNILTTVQLGDTMALLKWNSASDAETPAKKLSYNIRLGTVSGSNDIISAASDINTGFRRVARSGNMKSDTSFVLKNLSPGIYYWSIQTVDNVYAGSPFAPEHFFSIGLNPGVFQVQNNWNMVSVPVEVANFNKETVFPNASSNVFSYLQGYKPEDTLELGQGYWVKFPVSQTISLIGSVIAQETIRVQAGWNMVGSISTPVPVDQIGSIPPGMVTSQVWGYDNGYYSVTEIEPGKAYWLKVQQEGQIILSSSGVSITNTTIIVPTKELPPSPPDETLSMQVPDHFALNQNYPNPFNPTTFIKYQLPVDSRVTLKVYNTLGQEVAVLIDEMQNAGYKMQKWDANNLPSGMYICRLNAGNFSEVIKLTLVK